MLNELGRIPILHGDYAAASDAFRKVLAQYPDDRSVRAQLATSSARAGERDAGEAAHAPLRARPTSALGRAAVVMAASSHGRFFFDRGRRRNSSAWNPDELGQAGAGAPAISPRGQAGNFFGTKLGCRFSSARNSSTRLASSAVKGRGLYDQALALDRKALLRSAFLRKHAVEIPVVPVCGGECTQFSE